jgi:hypothetical protein
LGSFTFSFMAPYCTKFRDAEQCGSGNKPDKRHKERSTQKSESKLMLQQRTSCTIQGLVPTKSGGTSVYDDSPKEPLLNKLLNITAGFQLFPRSHPRICGISPLILPFNPCAE